MKLAVLAACVTLLIFAAANVVASALLIRHWQKRQVDWMHRSASAVLLFRCLPTVLSVALALLTVLPSFLAHEPRDRVETASLWIVLGAALGAVILGAAVVRGVVAVCRTRLAMRRWRRTATTVRHRGWPGAVWLVESDSLGVYVSGYSRPVLLMSRSVAAACTPKELTGIVSHERAHVSSGDLWKRLIFRCLPDVVGLTTVASRIERVWQARTEEEADLAAARGDRTLGIEIAGALVKVARRRLSADLPAAIAFDAGGPVERRVRLLLGRAPHASDARPNLWAALALTVLAPAALCGTVPQLSKHVHQAVEILVRTLT